MKDMNNAKLTSIDLPLFNGIVGDLFPGIEAPIIDYGDVSCCYSTDSIFIPIFNWFALFTIVHLVFLGLIFLET